MCGDEDERGKGVEYNPNHPLRGTTRRSYNEMVEKGLVDVAGSYIDVDRDVDAAGSYIDVDREDESKSGGCVYFIYEEQKFTVNDEGEDVFFCKGGVHD